MSDQVWQVASAATVAVVGALAAGISAFVQVRVANRDQRTRASNHLDLATRRTEFAVAWLDARLRLQPDGTIPEDVDVRVLEELEGAYAEAQRGLAEGTAALDVNRSGLIVDRIRESLLLRRGMSGRSKAIVVLFYFLIFLFAALLGARNLATCTLRPGEEMVCTGGGYVFVGNGYGYVAAMIVTIAVLRYLFKRWLDRREHRERARQPAEVQS